MKKIVILFVISFCYLGAIEIGEVPPLTLLDGKNGGNVNGDAWRSSMIKGKIYTLFYVDPDKKDLNDALAQRLKAQKYDRKKVNSIAIINLKATWLPDVLIESKLKSKQKEFPHTTYVKDKNKVLVKKWKLADDNSDILIFNQKGELIYKKFGKLSQKEITSVIELINRSL